MGRGINRKFVGRKEDLKESMWDGNDGEEVCFKEGTNQKEACDKEGENLN
jgi:hypothetical protein